MNNDKLEWRRMGNKKVSIIIPVYNTERYLEKCIQSALNQTYTNIEIICVDDGSTDRSGEILDRFAREDERMLVVHQKNVGESGARNVGLKNATGDYIGFMDCDDWIEPKMYEELVHALEESNADMAIASWYSEDELGSVEIRNRKPVREKQFDRKQLMRYIYERDSYRSFAYMWDKLYKKELLKDDNGTLIRFDETLRLGGDVLFLAQMAMNTEKAVYVDKAFYHYFQRSDSGCHSRDLGKRQEWLKAYIMIIEMFEKKGISQEILGYVKRFLAYHSSNVAKLAFEQKNKEALIHSQTLMRQYMHEYKMLNCENEQRICEFENILELELG